jgi:serine/threonine protein kinase
MDPVDPRLESEPVTLWAEEIPFTADDPPTTPVCEPAPVPTLLPDVSELLAPEIRSAGTGTPSLQPHDRLGQYEILQELGHGGRGIVVKALDTVLQRVVALKVLAPHLADQPEARERFIREAKAATAVRDEHVAMVYGVEGILDHPYLIMEYVEGISLQQRLDQDEPLPLTDIVHLGCQTACGLAAAHARGLIHHALKPSNILLDRAWRVKITDFGLARATDNSGLTQSGEVRGTPAYLSPEQAAGHEPDHRSDLFSLGSVLYTLCTGQHPFHASTSVAVLRKVRDEEPIWIKDLNPPIPDWLVALIARLHAKRPQDRFASAAEVARLLGDRLDTLDGAPRKIAFISV